MLGLDAETRSWVLGREMDAGTGAGYCGWVLAEGVGSWGRVPGQEAGCWV